MCKDIGGKVLIIAEESKKLSVNDIDGFIKPSIRSLKFLIPSVVLGSIKNEDEVPEWLRSFLMKIPDILLPMSFMQGGAPAPSE